MADVVTVLGWAVSIALAVPTVWLLLQVLASVGAASAAVSGAPAESCAPPDSVVVLVPAHDEEAGIARTLGTIKPQLHRGDRLVVVADNCTDATARIARDAGATVVERHDPARRGKGYALDAGVRSLDSQPPDTVIVIDADCDLRPASLDRLRAVCRATGGPVQSLYAMHAPQGAGRRAHISAFAWAVRNEARPLGGHRLGMPCQLMGTGMAFPWPLLRGANLATAHLVEDMQLGLDLAAAGHPPTFCPEARVDSWFPEDAASAVVQRARWERGHLAVLGHVALPHLLHALAAGRWKPAALAVDLCVPPLALLAALLVLELAAGVGLHSAVAGSSAAPVLFAAATLAAFLLAMIVAWRTVGRGVVSARELAGAPFYVLAKLTMYARFLRPGSAEWVRTKRSIEKEDA